MADSLPSKVVTASVTRRVAPPVKGSAAGAFFLAEPIRACIEYAKIAQAEKTERERIKAKRDVAVEAIRAQRDLILKYFELRFKERAGALSKCFGLLDEGLRTKDDRVLDRALHGIVGIIQENPLADFDAFREQMAKPGFELEL